jgi:hypothetical protein
MRTKLTQYLDSLASQREALIRESIAALCRMPDRPLIDALERDYNESDVFQAFVLPVIKEFRDRVTIRMHTYDLGGFRIQRELEAIEDDLKAGKSVSFQHVHRILMRACDFNRF